MDSAGEPELSRDWCSENPRLRLVNDQRGSRARPDATLHVRVASSHWPRGYRKRVLIGGGAEEGSGPQSPFGRRDGAPRSRHLAQRRGLGAFILQHGYTRLRAGELSAKGGDKLQPRPLRSLARGQPRARSPRGPRGLSAFCGAPAAQEGAPRPGEGRRAEPGAGNAEEGAWDAAATAAARLRPPSAVPPRAPPSTLALDE